MLIRSRGSLAHTWFLDKVLSPKFVFSLTSSICIASTTRCAHILHKRELATLVCTDSVLELEANFLSVTFEDELVFVEPHQIFETGTFASAFRTTASRFALAAIASRSLLLGASRRARPVPTSTS